MSRKTITMTAKEYTLVHIHANAPSKPSSVHAHGSPGRVPRWPIQFVSKCLYCLWPVSVLGEGSLSSLPQRLM